MQKIQAGIQDSMPIPASTAQTKQAPAEPAASFTDFLEKVKSSGTVKESASSPETEKPKESVQAEKQLDLKGLSYRDMQLIVKAAATKKSSAQMEGDPINGLLEKLLEMIQSLKGANDLEAVEPENLQSLLDLVGQLKKEIQVLTEKNGQEAALVQLMPLFTKLLDNPNIPQDVKAALNQLLEGNGNANGDAILELFQNNDPAEILSKLANIPKDLFSQLVKAGADATIGSGTTAGTNKPDVEGLAVSLAKEDTIAKAVLPKVATENLGTGNGQGKAMPAELPVAQVTTQTSAQDNPKLIFENAIRTVKEQMEQAGEAKSTEEKPKLDLEKLQSQVDSGAHLKNTGFANSIQATVAEKAEEVPLARQVQDGILNGLKKGAEEFKILLRPEGLGDLTVKLAKNAAGVMTLSLIAKNDETQKMLSRQMDVLKESLRPMRIEIDSILTERQESMLSGQQNFDAQNRSQWGGMPGDMPEKHGRTHKKPGEQGAQLAEEIEAVAQNRLFHGNTALDTYI